MSSYNEKSNSLKKTLATNTVIAMIAITVFVSAVILLYNAASSEKKANIVKNEELSAGKTASGIGVYLSTNADSVRLVAYALDEMLIKGRSDEDIQDFLVRQSAAQKNAVDPDSTGYYGYINGRFFSGVNWTPPEGFDATERPWYTRPFDEPGEVTVLDPYLDLETGKYKLALGTVLEDGVSVVSIDLPYTPIQSMVEKAVKHGDDDICMVISSENVVIAHSDKTEVGRDYDVEVGTLGAEIAKKLHGKEDYSFDFRFDGTDYFVYASYIQSGIRCISVRNTSAAYRPLRMILAGTVAAIAIIVLAVIYIFAASHRMMKTAEISLPDDTMPKTESRAFGSNLFERLIGKSGRSPHLGTSIQRLVFTVLIVAEALICTASIIQSREAVRTSVEQRMLDIANCASGAVNGNLLKDIKKEDDGTPEYQQIYDALAIFRDNVEVEYVYGIRAEVDGRFTFTVDPTIADPGEFGEEIVYTDALYRASQGVPSVDKQSYSDAWGTFYSAYSPVFTSDGQVAGIVGVDFSTEWYEGQMNRQTNQILMIYFAIFALVAFVGWLLSRFSIRAIIDPLNRMTEVAVRYENGDYSERIELDRDDEIGVLSHTLQAMAGSLQDQIKRSEEANEAKSIFLANMSHEIRTPINAVLGMAEMILRETKESRIRAYAVNVRCAGKDLLELINAMPNFSDEDTKQREAEKASVLIPNFTAPSARVLVVDDNDINLMVFANLIEHSRVQLDSAETADKALKLMEENKYDLIFLDHMMPGKDGIEVLHEMREKENGINLDTPVICLTANAINGAKDYYLDEGFDDYLTKPIDPIMLDKSILQYVSEDKIIKREDVEIEMEPEPEEKEDSALSWLFDQNVIDYEAGIRNNGSENAYLSIMKVFYNHIDATAEDIETLYKQNDIENYTIKIHALKSSARMIGATELGEKAQELENAGKARNMEYIEDNLRGFLNEYLSLKELLKPVSTAGEQEKEAEGNKPVADETLMSSVYEELKTAADNMDTSRIDEIFNEMDEYKIPERDAKLFVKLRAAADEFDYAAIMELIQNEL